MNQSESQYFKIQEKTKLREELEGREGNTEECKNVD